MARKNEPGYREYRAELDRQIAAGEFRHATLICGNEDYLRTSCRNALRTAILGDGDAMNASYFHGSDINITEILDIADTLPFFAERRVIVMENTGLFAKAGGEVTERLLTYLTHVPETTYFIFVEEETNGTTKLYKAVKKDGFLCKCDTPDDNELRAFIRSEMRENGVGISGGTASLLLSYAGTDMLNIQSECRKLADYCYGRQEATDEDVRAICSVTVKDRVFELINAIVTANRPEAMKIYMDLIRIQTPPQVILSLMLRQFNQLLQIGELLGEGKTSQEIAQLLHLNPWVLQNRLQPLVRGKSAMGLTRALQDCVQANMDYRSGRIDARIAVEKLIITYSAKDNLTIRRK